MLQRIAPYLAMIGIHKNGTWAVQKVIECSASIEERAMVVHNLRPFCPALMADSLGNYVCAGTLHFGAPHNDYIFDAMVDRMWDIAQNRFGARCMRTCLESPHTSLYQKVSPLMPRLAESDDSETSRHEYYSQFCAALNQSEWRSSSHLVGRPVQVARSLRATCEPVCTSRYPPVHP
jgi:hypothetical protein